MIKLALLGDTKIQHYTVADRLWELISVVIDMKFKFSIVPLSAPSEAASAFDVFKKDANFVGFNIAPVEWNALLADKVDQLEDDITSGNINTVYKTPEGTIIGVNTYPIAVQQALEKRVNLYKCRQILIIGAKGTGLPLARHFQETLDKEVYLYDAFTESTDKQPNLQRISSLSDVSARQYDVIINTTPLGRYYFDERIDAFTSPLDLETLSHITHDKTIVQETNYLPTNTLLLQMARHLKLEVADGAHVLALEATESLRRFFGVTLSDTTINMLVEEIRAYIADRELEIHEQAGD